LRVSLLMICLCVLLTSAAAAQDSLYVRLVGQYDMSRTAYGVAAAGDYVCVANNDTFRVVSVADPAHPVEVGHCGGLGGARGVAVSGDYAYVADMDSSLRVFSIADPAHPVEVGRCRTSDLAISVVVSGGYAYVGGWSGLQVISVADPAHPVEVGYSGGYYPYDLAVNGSYVYAAASSAGLLIISVADPSHPTVVGNYNASSKIDAVAVNGEYAYIASTDSTFRVISVADPANPVEVGRCYYTAGALAAPQDMEVIRGYALLATWNGGVRVVDVADPAFPTEVGHYTLGESWSLALDERCVYVTTSPSLYILKFYQLGDLDIDSDSLDVVADTLQLRRWVTTPGEFLERAYGEFVLANTSASYNPDTTDGPSRSPVDSISFTASLAGPSGSIDSIAISHLPTSLAQGQTVVCTLAAYVPVGLMDGDYTGSIIVSGKDTAGLLVQDSCYVLVKKFGDIDVDKDSLDVVADTIRVRPRLVSAGPPPTYTEYAYGRFVLVNTTESLNPDTTDGPSRSPVRSLRYSGVLSGPHGTIDSIMIPDLPESLEIGQAVVCTLAVYVPSGLPEGDYSGPIVIRSDSLQPQIAETVYALVSKLGDLDADDDSLDVVHDTMNLHAQPAGSGHSPYTRGEFMLVNTSSAYNPDTADGPSRSTLREVEVKVEVKVKVEVEGQNGSMDSVYVLNLPESLAVGQAVECTLALVLPDSAPPGGYVGVVTISAYDTLGYKVQDSFFLRVNGTSSRQDLDSLRVGPIPFKPHHDPAHDAIHFRGLPAGARAVVYDASGRSVWTATESGDGHLKWDAEVASGIYVYLVVSADGKSSKVGKLSVIR
jgi:hypothetical protein